MGQQNRKIGFTTHNTRQWQMDTGKLEWDWNWGLGLGSLKVKVKIAAAAQMDLRVANFN